MAMTNVTPASWRYHRFPKRSIINLLILNLITLSALFVLIGISIVVAGSFLAAFLWSVYKGQFEDDYTPSVRMLFDNETKSTPIEKEVPIKIQTKTNQ
jgi:cbb3-type cytochrome oxidase maturation protein